MTRRWTEAERQQIAADYKNGATIPELKKKYGAGDSSINKALDKEHVQRRAPGQNKHTKAQQAKTSGGREWNDSRQWRKD